MHIKPQLFISRAIGQVKYARRFIRIDGIVEFIYFKLNKPRFYEEYELVVEKQEYPSQAFRDLNVPKTLRVTKWNHYFEIYDQYFSNFRNNNNLKVLEIGVAGGGSLEMWRSYFGPNATIFGIDIDEKCSQILDSGCEIRIGSQVDTSFLDKVISEMGGIDVVIDDGSHLNSHVIETFTHLFPKLNAGGTYLIEDSCTSYWPGQYKGGLRRRGTSIEFFKNLTDLPNRYFYSKKLEKRFRFEGVESVHFHPSVITIQKLKEEDKFIWRNYS